MKIVTTGLDHPTSMLIKNVVDDFYDGAIMHIADPGSNLLNLITPGCQNFDLIFLDEEIYRRFEPYWKVGELPITCPYVILASDPARFESTTRGAFFQFIPKPLTTESLKTFFRNYISYRIHFGQPDVKPVAGISKGLKRVLGRKGAEYYNISIEKVSYFYVNNRIVYLITTDSVKFVTDFDSLGELYALLDKSVFYRINRQVVVSISAIKKFRTHEKFKIALELSVSVPHELIVSPDNASFFRKWIRQLN